MTRQRALAVAGFARLVAVLAALAPVAAEAQLDWNGHTFPRLEVRGPRARGASALTAGLVAPAPGVLDEPTPLQEGALSLRYLSRVGGVAFGGTAQPIGGLELVGLGYDPARPDGERLQVTVQASGAGRVAATARLADWMLVPIARFADGDQDAAATLFGRLAGDEETRRIRESGVEILAYHPAFINTLLGLRLFQADMLILDPASAELPTIGGRVLLGAGESPPDVDANRRRLAELHGYVRGLTGHPFQSYVVGDYSRTVRFGVRGGALYFQGDPYWHCWRMVSRDPGASDRARAAANEWANRIVRRELEHERLYAGQPALRREWTQPGAQARAEAIFDRRVSRALLLLMPDYSERLSEKVRALGGINPSVYEALRRTMHFAALFRHFRDRDPEGYRAFVGRLATVTVQPAVATPVLFQRGSSP